MKYFQVVCVLGFLLTAAGSLASPAPVIPATMIVSGSNDPLVNGTYTYNGDSGGKASWAKGEYVLRWSTAVMGYSWNIEKPTPGYVYYSTWDPTDIPPEFYWSCQANSVNPCTPPSVTEEPLPDTLFVSGTKDAFLNGAYTRGLNRNGFPGTLWMIMKFMMKVFG